MKSHSCVLNFHSSCKNYTLHVLITLERCVITLISVKITLVCVETTLCRVESHSAGNILRLEITLVRVEITVVRFEITITDLFFTLLGLSTPINSHQLDSFSPRIAYSHIFLVRFFLYVVHSGISNVIISLF
jgi:hypothetical protein